MPNPRITQLRRECLKQSEATSDLLKGAAAAAATVGDEDFASWLSEEMHGYAFPERVPAYRKLDVQAVAILSGSQTPRAVAWSATAPSAERTRLVRISVSEVERILGNAHGNQRFFMSQVIDEEFADLEGFKFAYHRIEGAVGRDAIDAMLIRVRQRIVEWADGVLARDLPTSEKDESVPLAPQPPVIFDAELRDRCADLLAQFHQAGQVHRLDTVIMEATKILENRLRKIVGDRIADDEKNLMSAVFAGDNPLIRLSEDKGEQEAGHLLFRGAYGFIRNPFHHRLVRLDPMALS